MSDLFQQKPITTRRDHMVMLSRVANSLYWMSRYIERSENVARLLDVNLQLMLDFADFNDQQLKEHWLPILCSAGDEKTFFKLYDRANSENVTEFLTFREENPNSIISCLFTARENARQVRDQISLEMFEAINECYLFLKSKNAHEVWKFGAHDFFEQIKKYSHLFQGLTDSTFLRTEGYEFINLGKFLERADKTTRILDLKYHILLPSVADVGLSQIPCRGHHSQQGCGVSDFLHHLPPIHPILPAANRCGTSPSQRQGTQGIPQPGGTRFRKTTLGSQFYHHRTNSGHRTPSVSPGGTENPRSTRRSYLSGIHVSPPR